MIAYEYKYFRNLIQSLSRSTVHILYNLAKSTPSEAAVSLMCQAITTSGGGLLLVQLSVHVEFREYVCH